MSEETTWKEKVDEKCKVSQWPATCKSVVYFVYLVVVFGLNHARNPQEEEKSTFPWKPQVICTLHILFSLPLSQVRLQTQPKPKPGESLLYAGTIDCFKKTLAKEVSMHTDANSGIY